MANQRNGNSAERVVDLVVEGLNSKTSQEKQWYLEQILEVLIQDQEQVSRFKQIMEWEEGSRPK